MANATLMMVTYNRLDLTKQTLDNLYKNTKIPFNLVIVDNGSTDGTVEFLKGLKDVHLLFNEENKGIAIGRNQALKMANDLETEWFCTIDNDVWVPEGWLSECIEVLDKNKTYGAIGVNMENVKYPMVNLNGKTFQRKPQGNLGTACMVFNKKLHKMIGYFNTEYISYAHEDADFGMRTRAIGYQLGYIKDMGRHVGEGENDVGEYREFKNKFHKENLPKFHQNAQLYMSRKKSVYINYE